MRSILQTPEWAQFKKSQGWEILNLGNLFIHKRSLPFGQNFLYLPEVSADDISPSQIEELKKITKDNNSIFCRLELIDRFNENSYKLIRSFGFEKAFEQVQPKWRQIISLELSEDEILAQMKSKGRYNIKVAEKNKLFVEKMLQLDIDRKSEKAANIFYYLYSQTVKRNEIAGRNFLYFKNLLDSFSKTDYFEVYTVYFERNPLSSAIVSFYDGVASYLYGGSSRSHKEVMAPYLMHWQIMKDAKARGMKKYDMIGRDKPDTSGHWAGVTRFKEQFGGEAVEVLGSFDYVNRQVAYRIFKFVEKMRRK